MLFSAILGSVVSLASTQEETCIPCEDCPQPVVAQEAPWQGFFLMPGMPYSGDPYQSGGYPVPGVQWSPTAGGFGPEPGGIACLCWWNTWERVTEEVNGQIRSKLRNKQDTENPTQVAPKIEECCGESTAGLPQDDVKECGGEGCEKDEKCGFPCFQIPFIDDDGDGEPFPFDDDEVPLNAAGNPMTITLDNLFEALLQELPPNSEIPCYLQAQCPPPADGSEPPPDPNDPNPDSPFPDDDNDGLPNSLDIDIDNNGVIDNGGGILPDPTTMGYGSWAEFASDIVPHLVNGFNKENKDLYASKPVGFWDQVQPGASNGVGDIGGDGFIGLDDMMYHLKEEFEGVVQAYENQLDSYFSQHPELDATGLSLAEKAQLILDQDVSSEGILAMNAFAVVDAVNVAGSVIHTYIWGQKDSEGSCQSEACNFWSNVQAAVGYDAVAHVGLWQAAEEWVDEAKGQAMTELPPEGGDDDQHLFGVKPTGSVAQAEPMEGKPYAQQPQGDPELGVTPQEQSQKKRNSSVELTGDPIDVATGALIHSEADIIFGGGSQTLSFERVYSSRSTAVGVFGIGWSVPLGEAHILMGKGQVPKTTSDTVDWPGLSLSWGDGSYSYLEPTDDVSSAVTHKTDPRSTKQLLARPWVYGGLLGTSGATPIMRIGYEVRDQSGTLYKFCAASSYMVTADTAVCWLHEVQDRFGNAITYKRHPDGRLKEIVDSHGRWIRLTYSPEGEWGARLTQVEGSGGQTIQYEYEEAFGSLKAVKSQGMPIYDGSAVTVGEGIREYTYSGTGLTEEELAALSLKIVTNLVQARKGGQVVFTNEYYQVSDSEGASYDRISRQYVDDHWEEYRYYPQGQTLTSAYGVDYDWITDKLDSSGLRTTWLTRDSYIVQRCTLNAKHGSDWSPTGELFESDYYQGDLPSEWVALWEYDSLGRLVRQTDTTDELYSRGKQDYIEYRYDSDWSNVYSSQSVVAETAYYSSSEFGEPIERVTRWQLEPVYGTRMGEVDFAGRTSVKLYTHQGLSFDEARQSETLGIKLWGLLPLTEAELNEQILDGFANLEGGETPTGPVVPAAFGHTLPGADLDLRPGRAAYSARAAITVAGGAGLGSTELLQPFLSANYREDGRLESTLDETGVVERYEYQGSNMVAHEAEVSGDLRRTEMQYDATGQRTSLLNWDGQELRTMYSSDGRLLESKRMPRGAGQGAAHIEGPYVTRYYYNQAGRMVSVQGGGHESVLGSDYYAYTGGFETKSHVYSDSGRRLSTTRTDWSPGGIAISTFTEGWNYDAAGRIIQSWNGLGDEHSFELCPQGGVLAVTRSSTVHESWEQSEVLVRQGLAQPWKRTDTHGGFWIIESDSEGKPLRKEDEYGLSTEYAYSSTLEVDEVELYDGAGVLIAHERRDFDGSGRLLSDEVRHFVPGDNGFDSWVKTSYGFDARGSLMWYGVLEEESAPATICVRDSWGRLVSSKALASHGASGDVVGVERVYSRNEYGELVGVTVYPEGSAADGGPALTDSTLYDSFGRPVQSTNRLGRTAVIEYDGFGHVSAKHDVASNHRTRQTSTIAGRILRTEESDESGSLSDRVMVYEYGPQGFLSRYRLTSGSWTTIQFDEWGRPVEKLLPSGQLETFEYDSDGLLHKHTSGGQVEKTYAYALGRLTQVGYENISDTSVPGVTKNYEYDSTGDIFALEDITEGGSSVRLQWQRDSLGQIHSEQTIVDGVPLDHRTYRNTGWGHMESQGFDSLGLEFGYQTDALGRVGLVDLAGTDVLRCSNYFAGAAKDVELVGVGQLANAYLDTGLVQRRSAMNASGALIGAESYSWNSAGELVGRSREDQARVEYFEYDAYSRLREWGLGADGAQGAPLIRWGVDEYNNIRRVDAFSDAYDGGFLVDEVNAIEWFNPLWGPFQYDAVGQETGRGVGTLGSMSHDWDAAGRPISNTYEVAGSLWSVEWTYDALDRPIRKQTVMTASPETVGDWVNMYWTDGVVARSEGPEGDRVYLYTGGQSAPVAQYDPSSGQLEGVLSDHQGSVIGVFDSSGMKDAFAYRPYGQAWQDDFSGPVTSLPNKQRLLYLARPHDIGTGMVRLGARTYDPFTGRFLSQDPAQEQGGINLYAYAKGNPTSLSDPTGLAPSVGQNSAPSAGNVPTEEKLAELGPRDAGLFMGGYDGEPVELNIPSDWSKRDHLEFEFFRGLALMGKDADTVNSYQSLADAGKALQREAFEAALNDLWRSFDVPSREMYEKFGLLEMAVKDPTLALAESHLGAAGLWLTALPETIAYSASYAVTGDAIVSTQVETGVGIAAMATGVAGAAKGLAKGVVKLFARNSGRSAAAASSVGEAATASAAGNAARGGLKWPPNRGFAGKPRSTTLQPGTRIDRYGSEAGTFTSPAGTPFGARSLPPEAAGAPLRGYEVVKPLPAQSGAAAPWFGQPGGGMQYELGQSVKSLVDQGFLRRIP